MAMREPDPQVAVGDDFGEREVCGVDIEVTFDDLEVWGGGAEEVVGFFVG